ncbi:MAG: hypothetical protein NTY22_08885, partial [Proteobacteria bacterium]|nr:hypothetical protein [Pseudomonadota bacterium]
ESCPACRAGDMLPSQLKNRPFGTVFQLLDVVREVITFWKTNKEHIYIPNYRDGLFKITQPSAEEMALGSYTQKYNLKICAYVSYHDTISIHIDIVFKHERKNEH